MDLQLTEKSGAEHEVVAFWGREDLLSWAVEHFLRDHGKPCEIIRIRDRESLAPVLQMIAEKCPRVIIVCDDESELPGDWLLHLMHACPSIKIISLNLHGNSVDVYQREAVVVNGVADLLALVEA